MGALWALGISLLTPAMPCLLIALALRRLGQEVTPRELTAISGLYGMLGGAVMGYLKGGNGALAALLFVTAGLLLAVGGLATNVWLCESAAVTLLGTPLRNTLIALAVGGLIGALYGSQRATSEKRRRYDEEGTGGFPKGAGRDAESLRL